jgi:hypothetical protein
MNKAKKKDPICRSFRQDFPEFVDRVMALGLRISLSPGRRAPDQDRVFWADGYKQLTGYTTRADGARFTRDDAAKNIHKFLTAVELDRAEMEQLSARQRFDRVMDQMRQIKPQHRMIGGVRLPGGDCGHCFFNADYDGGVDLLGIGTVASGKAEWRRGETSAAQLARFCDALDAKFQGASGTAAKARGEPMNDLIANVMNPDQIDIGVTDEGKIGLRLKMKSGTTLDILMGDREVAQFQNALSELDKYRQKGGPSRSH